MMKVLVGDREKGSRFYGTKKIVAQGGHQTWANYSAAERLVKLANTFRSILEICEHYG